MDIVNQMNQNQSNVFETVGVYVMNYRLKIQEDVEQETNVKTKPLVQ